MKKFAQPPTVREALQQAVAFLKEKQINNARLEAEALLSSFLGLTRTRLLVGLDETVSEKQWKEFSELLKQRGRGCPLQYLTGKQEFMSLEFTVNPAVLIPRADTELLVEKVLEFGKDLNQISRILRIVDVGTGSGAIAVSLAYYWPGAKISAVDYAEKALKLAAENARNLGVQVEFVRGDLLEPFLEKGPFFDVIVSNPPYIPTSQLAELPREVRREPVLALDGGKDGLDYYRRLVPQAVELLVPGGILALETAWDQGTAVKEILHNSGFRNIEIIKDYGNRDRVVMAYRQSFSVK